MAKQGKFFGYAGRLLRIDLNTEKVAEEYCEARAWDRETGRPTRDKLRQLGLDSL